MSAYGQKIHPYIAFCKRLEVLGYMKEITESQALNAEYQADGDEVVIRT